MMLGLLMRKAGVLGEGALALLLGIGRKSLAPITWDRCDETVLLHYKRMPDSAYSCSVPEGTSSGFRSLSGAPTFRRPSLIHNM